MTEQPSTPSGTPTPLPTRARDALQHALSAEHAAVYGYGVVGAYVDAADREAAAADLAAHRARRDRLRGLLVSRGAAPVAAAPAYGPPDAVQDAREAAALAVRLEESVAAYAADVVAVTRGDLRTEAALALQEATLRALRWGGRPVPFPGLPERAG